MGSAHEVRMPQLGETVAEGTVSAWLKQPGDEVAEREPLLEVATDKVDTEIESTVAGVLQRILVEEGQTVPVGTPLAEIALRDANASEGAESSAPVAEGRPASAAQRARSASAQDSTAANASEGAESSAPPAEPSAPEPPAAAPQPPDPPVARSSGAPASERATGSFTASDLVLSPRVRRIIADNSVELEELAAFATGPRVDRKTMEAFLARRGQADQGERVVPFSAMRKRVAGRMVGSLATAAHVVTAIEVDFAAVAAARASGPGRLTWLPFVAWALARTLPDFERLNATVRDTEALVVHSAVHLGIAVDLDGEGLVVPVVRDAHTRGVVELAEQIERAAAKARAGELRPDDVAGGTCTITSQGPHGTLFTAPIINQPQVATLSVDGISRRPVVVTYDSGREEIVARDTGVLALSWDHRAIDGVYAARFLAALRDRLRETRWQDHL